MRRRKRLLAVLALIAIAGIGGYFVSNAVNGQDYLPAPNPQAAWPVTCDASYERCYQGPTRVRRPLETEYCFTANAVEYFWAKLSTDPGSAGSQTFACSG